MNLRNLIIYNLTKKVDLTQVEQNLADFAFNPCHATQLKSMGWSPLFEDGLALELDGSFWFKLTEERKDIPNQTVNEQLDQRIHRIEQNEGRQVKRAEKLMLKDAVISDLLPQAFTKKSDVYGFIRNDIVYVFTSSHAKAEDFLALLRKSLGSLPAVPMECVQDSLTKWISDYPPNGLSLGDSAILEGISDVDESKKAKATIRNQDLKGDEVARHLEAGKQPVELGLVSEAFGFKLTEDFKLKSLTPNEELLEAATEDAENKQDFQLPNMKFMQEQCEKLVHYLISNTL